MGNIFTNIVTNYDYVRFQKSRSDEKYFFEIDIEEFDVDVVKHKLELLANNNSSFGEKNIYYVLSVLNHINNIETTDIIQQINGYLFHKYSGVPFLAIRNINARKYQMNNKINVGEQDGFYYRCNLSQVFADYNWW